MDYGFWDLYLYLLRFMNQLITGGGGTTLSRNYQRIP